MVTLYELIVLITYDIKAGGSKFTLDFYTQLSKCTSESWVVNLIFFSS